MRSPLTIAFALSALADDGLTIAENLIAGRGLPTGTEECTAPDCRALAERNTLSAATGLFREPTRRDLRLRSGRSAPTPVLPSFSETDLGE